MLNTAKGKHRRQRGSRHYISTPQFSHKAPPVCASIAKEYKSSYYRIITFDLLKMGKTKKAKPRVAKVNPIGIPSVRDVEFNENFFGEDEQPEGPIPAIVEQLQSVSIEEKMCALQTLAVISQNKQRIDEILESEIVKIIASWLVDPNKSIRNATAGALRNLSVSGITVCESLVEQDVLTPLLALFNEYALDIDWKPTFDTNLNDQTDERADTFLHAINLLWNLCESTSVALNNFNQTRVVESFIRCLNYEIFGFDISIAVAQCLLVISEDNPVAWRTLSAYTQDLVSILAVTVSETGQANKHPLILLSTLAAGIMSNVPALFAPHLTIIFTMLSRTLDLNHRNVLGVLTSRLPLNERKKGNDIFVTEDTEPMEDETEQEAAARRRKQDLPTAIDVEVKTVGWMLEAQRIAAETITNFCSNDDEGK